MSKDAKMSDTMKRALDYYAARPGRTALYRWVGSRVESALERRGLIERVAVEETPGRMVAVYRVTPAGLVAAKDAS